MALYKHLGLAALLAVGALALACGGDDGGDDDDTMKEPNPAMGGNNDNNTPPSNSGALQVAPATSYTGYDGKSEFRVPLKVRNGPVMEWKASDTSALEIQGTDTSAIVTVKKAGNFFVTATGPMGVFSAKIQATQFSGDDCKFGQERYNNGVIALRSADGGVFMVPTMPPTGGMVGAGAFGGVMLDNNAACSNCHGETTMLPIRIRHTPTQVGGYNDEGVINLFSNGVKPAGANMRLLPPEIFAMFHKWQMMENEKKGILCYLRSLAPAEMGPLPGFGGMGMGTGAGGLDAGVP